MFNARTAAGGLALGVLILLAIGAETLRNANVPYPEASQIGQNVQTFQELSARFTALAEKKGAVYAFGVLKRADLPPNTDLHLLGHVVGDELYKQKGVAGIADCMQDFRNACSHSIVIGALNEFGSEKALSLIRDACEKAPGGSGAYTMCYHGLGHGVFAYYGYDLSDTVEFCKKAGTVAYHEQEYTQCVGGAVMELMGGGGHDRDKWILARERYLTDDPLSPCIGADIPKRAKGMCLTYLTPRLFEEAGAELGNPDPATFPRAFGFCEAISQSKPELREACFGGFGKEFIVLAGARDIRRVDAFSDEEYARAIQWCNLAERAEARFACVGEALSSVFWGGENDPSASFRFCSLATGPERDACFRRLGESIDQYLTGEKRATECRKLPAQSQNVCIRA
jgi:hypothetical protein